MPLDERRLGAYGSIRRELREEKFININPIQRGGILTPEARNALVSFGDGYSICDYCVEGRLDLITRPPLKQFHEDLAAFLDMDQVRIVTRCREAIYIVFKSLGKPGDTVVVDSLAHYSTYLAAEAFGLKVKEVPHGGYPEFRLDLDAYATKIDEVKDETGNLPVAALLTHADYIYGNLNDPKRVSKVTKKKGVPLILNAAYTAGVMPVRGKELGVDFITCSGHKSWAACAPIGILATTEGGAASAFERSKIEGEWSKCKFEMKELHLLGCAVGGAPLATLIASFPTVVERIKRWGEEVDKARFLVRELEKIEGTRKLGIRPAQHFLNFFETPGFDRIAREHKRRGWYLYEELKKRSIVGIQPGLTKHLKLGTYGLSREQVERVGKAFQEIAEKYKLALK